jgi:DNA-binding winged helix-turn-helix (wHTH) protein/Tol biopolymer transport system component
MTTRAGIYRFGPFSFDLAQQELRRRTRRLPLSVSLLKLLTLFLTRRGELITRDEIAAALWEDSSTIDVVTGINTAVRRLRAQLDDDPSAPTYIETVIGIGYRFIAEVEEIEDAGAVGNAAVPVLSPVDRAPDALEVADLAAGPAIPVDALSQSAKDASREAQPFSKTGSHRLTPAVLVLGAVLLLLALGAAVLQHRSAKLVATKPGAPHLGSSLAPPLAQITFNDEENRITAEAISPDGHLVAYSDRYGISVHELDRGADRLLTSPSSFRAERISWPPGEDWVLVSGVDQASHRRQAWAVFMHGETPRLLLQDAGLAVVSPDGSHIAFTRAQNSEIWLADGSGQNPHLLVARVEGDSFTCLLWSAQGDRLIDDRISGSPLSDVAGADQTGAPPRSIYESVDIRSGKLLAQQDNVRFNSGFLLKDGRFLFFVNGDLNGAKLMMVKTDPATGEFLAPPQPVSPTQVQNVGGDADFLSASANGGWIGALLTSHTSDVDVAEVHWPGPTLQETARLTDRSANNYPDAFTPSGDAILFDRNANTQLIARQRLGEKKREIVAQLPGIAAMATFSPDGKWILFTEFAGSPARAIGIFSLPAGGGQPQQLRTTGAIEEFRCSISSAGSCVIRESNEKKELVFFALDPVQGMQQELARIPWEPTMLGDWSVSPDGSTVAMANHDPKNPGIQLIQLSPRRSAPSTIPVAGFGEVCEATWSPDAQGFFVETKMTTGFNLLYVDRTGHAKLLRQSPNSIWGIPSRDGKKLAFPSLTDASNVWAGRTLLPSE